MSIFLKISKNLLEQGQCNYLIFNFKRKIKFKNVVGAIDKSLEKNLASMRDFFIDMFFEVEF
jgi:hypothetical protein